MGCWNRILLVGVVVVRDESWLEGAFCGGGLYWRYKIRWPTLRENWFMWLVNGLSGYPAVIIVFTVRVIVCFRVTTRGVVTRVLWCYGSMEYMTEQVDAHNEVTHR